MARPVKISDEAILDGAIDLFWRHGADRVSIRDLERSLEVRAPSIYRRFDSKDELLARCLDRYVDQQIGGRVGYFFADTSDPLEVSVRSSRRCCAPIPARKRFEVACSQQQRVARSHQPRTRGTPSTEASKRSKQHYSCKFRHASTQVNSLLILTLSQLRGHCYFHSKAFLSSPGVGQQTSTRTSTRRSTASPATNQFSLPTKQASKEPSHV